MDDVHTLILDGKIEQAEAKINQYEATSAGNAQWHYNRGLLLEAKGELEEAIKAYEAAIQIAPDCSEAVFHLARCLDLHGNEEWAIQLYESLATQVPTHVNALLNLAIICEDTGRYQKANECVNRVLAEYPNHPRALLFQKDIQSSMSMRYDENEEIDAQKRDAILDTPVSDFELSVRSRNCLKKMNINTLGDLLRISESELLSYKNFGETSLNEIKAMLKQKTLRLGQLKEDNRQPVRPSTIKQAAPEGSPEILSRYLSEVEFSGRSRKCLQRLNLLSVGELVIKSEAELLATKNFGQTSLNEIKAKLAEFGLSLRKTD